MKTRLILIMVLVFLTAFLSAQDNKSSVQLAAAIYEEEVTGNLDKAVDLYLDILKKFPDNRSVAAKTLYHLGLVNEKMGMQKARDYFTRLVNTYPDQTDMVTLAKARLKALGNPAGTAVTAKAEGPVTRRILADASDVRGVLTADGKYIRRLDWNTGDVIQFDVASGQTSRITNKGFRTERLYYVEGYVFSRDGKQIAFDIETRDRGNQLRVRDLDGLNLRTLYSVSEAQAFDWSPDAGSILALRKTPDGTGNQLVLISTTDGSVRVLRSIDAAWYMLTQARFSPDGQYVAFSLVGEGHPAHGDIYMMTADGSNEVVVAGHLAEDQLLDWTPDGRSLLFRSDRSGTWDIWAVRIRGGKQQGEPELLKKDFGRYSQVLGFAPNGSLYYRTLNPSGRLYVGEIDLKTGKLIVPPAPVTTRYNGAPSRIEWSPDGRQLLYVSFGRTMGNGNNNLTIRSADSGEERFLSTSLRNVWDIHWAPDSKSLLAWGMTVSGNALFRVDAETGEITKLADGRWAPKMSRDGKIMVYMGQGGIRRRNLDTGEDSIIEKIGVSWFEDLSPDGQEVVVQTDGTVKTASLDGGEPCVLFRNTKPYVVRWTSDGHYIIAQALDSISGLWAATSEIWRIPVQGGTPLKLDLSIAGMEDFALHPDNRHFAYSVNDGTKTELWVFENFLKKEMSEADDQFTMRKLDYAQLSYPYAEISPDGKKIAYYIAGQTKQGIGVLDLKSGATKVLVESGAGGQASKVWSPQSNKIAYRLNGNELHICDIDAANTQLFYKSPEYKLYPTDWSKDGKKILCFFEAQDMTMRIGTIASDGQVRFLASGNQTEFSSEPKFSPDGRYIVCSMKDEKGNSDIFILSSDGSQKERVASYPGRDENPVWSPDGKYLLFISDRNRSADLWGIEVNNGKAVGAPFIIKRDLGWHTMIQDLTTKGKLFLFMMGGDEPGNMFTIPVDQVSRNLKGPIAPISVYPTDHSFPRYSPDGKMIAFLSRRGQVGYPKLFVMDEKGVEREIALQSHYAVNIAWHQDNKSLFFAGWDKNLIPGIYEVLLETGEIKSIYINNNFDFKMNKGILVNINLLPDTGEIMFFNFLGNDSVEVITLKPGTQQPEVVLPLVKMPFWGLPSPDGENICYRLGDSLMVVTVSDGGTRHIGSSTLNLEATWSPDGESLMFREGSGLRIFSLKENSTRTLYQAPGGKTIGGMEMYANSWSPDRNYFVFTERDTSESATSTQKIILISPVDGSFNVLGEAPEDYRMSELRWSPDGSRVIATGNSTSTKRTQPYEYWLLENFLPK
jgi:Tol biopolymer transport system component